MEKNEETVLEDAYSRMDGMSTILAAYNRDTGKEIKF